MSVLVHDLLTDITERQRDRSETAYLDAQVLLAHYLNRPRSWILAHPEASLTELELNAVRQATDRLDRGEPLPYIIGHWEFYGLDYLLTPQVLIPRPETELLVDTAIRWLRAYPARRNAIDVGTGSGCIGISLAKNIPDLYLWLTDISAPALDVARMNAKKLKPLHQVEFIQADLLKSIDYPFDLICANLPYIPTPVLRTLPVAKTEPLLALDGGEEGTTFIYKLLQQAKDRLVAGGLLLLEMDSSEAKKIKSYARALYPASRVEILKDLSGQDRYLRIERSSLIVHICPRDEWQNAIHTGAYQDDSLLQNGFIHCSMPEQLLEVANRYYQNIPDLVLLWIDPARLLSDMRWEISEAAIYPHIYGTINLDAICSIAKLSADADGVYRALHLPD